MKENCIIATYILSLCATTCTCSNILVNDKIISNQRGFSYPYVQIFVSRPFSTCSLPPFLMVVRKLFSRWSNPTKINTSILHLEITRLFLWLSDDAIFLVLICYKLKNLPFFGGAWPCCFSHQRMPCVTAERMMLLFPWCWSVCSSLRYF